MQGRTRPLCRPMQAEFVAALQSSVRVAARDRARAGLEQDSAYEAGAKAGVGHQCTRRGPRQRRACGAPAAHRDAGATWAFFALGGHRKGMFWRRMDR
jgi:hypothetical protein